MKGVLIMVTIFNKTYETFYDFWADIKAQEVTKDMSPEDIDKLFDIAASVYDEEEAKVANVTTAELDAEVRNVIWDNHCKERRI